MTLGDVDRTGRIERTVRRVFALCVQQSREPLADGLDDTLLDALANAQTGLLILDRVMQWRGGLSPAQIEAYERAIELRDECLKALQIANPYARAVN